jgi:protein-histidine pros-kinase
LSPAYDHQGAVSGVIGVATDVTERQRAEQTRRELELRYWALFEQANDIVFILDLDGNVVEANARAHEMFGYAVGEFSGKLNGDLAVEREHSQSVNVLAALKSGQTVPIYERTFRRKDGTEFPTEVNLVLVRDAEGNVLHIQSIVRDITERKRAERKFRAVLESAPDAMVIVNTQGEIVLVNAQTQRLFGYAAGELVGQPVEILVPEGLRDKHAGHRATYCASPRSRPMGVDMELYARRKDGAQFSVEISLSPLETEEGMLVSSTIRDITERKRAEEALRESEMRYRLVAKATNDVIWDWDLKTNQVFWSEAIHTVLGYPEARDDFDLSWWEERIHPEDRDRVLSSLNAVIEAGGTVWSGEYRFRRADGSYAR